MRNMLQKRMKFIGLIALLSANCSYIQHHEEKAQFAQIQSELSLSSLDEVHEYTTRTPFTKTFEFEFYNSSKQPYALVFYIIESDFANSIIKHRKPNDLHRNAVRIDENFEILTALNQHLPKPDSITWHQVAKQIEHDDARDGYYILQEYIRYKIREL